MKSMSKKRIYPFFTPGVEFFLVIFLGGAIGAAAGASPLGGRGGRTEGEEKSFGLKA